MLTRNEARVSFRSKIDEEIIAAPAGIRYPAIQL